MPQPLWDASALAKRYPLERGSDTVEAIFTIFPLPQMDTTFLSYAETYSLLQRKQTRGDMNSFEFGMLFLPLGNRGSLSVVGRRF